MCVINEWDLMYQWRFYPILVYLQIVKLGIHKCVVICTNHGTLIQIAIHKTKVNFYKTQVDSY
jgi:hypothetical protein